MNFSLFIFFIKNLLVYNIIHYLCRVQSVKSLEKVSVAKEKSPHSLVYKNNKTNNR